MARVAFVFPGQGSQSVGMLGAFADSAVVGDIVRRASEALGEDIGRMIGEGPAERLELTVNTQPCLLTASYAIYAAWRAAGDEVVEAVNFNAPAQIVIAGHRAAVARACDISRRLGAKRAVTLAVSVPFHSSLLASAADRLRVRLASVDVRSPSVPVINNVDAAVESDPQRVKDALARQAAGPVRWTQIIQAMSERGITHVVECGPGKVLSALTRRIAPGLQSLSVSDPDSLRQ